MNSAGLQNTQGPFAAALRAAMQCLQEGRPAEAERIYNQIVQQAPGNTAALFNLGLLAARRGSAKEAQLLFKKVLDIDPKDADAAVSLAITYADMGMATEAQAAAAQALALSPAPPALSQLGAMYGELGLTEKALETLRAALKAQPENINALATLAAYDKLATDDPACRALIKLSATGDRLPPADRARVEFALGKARLDQGDEKTAYAAYALGNKIKKSTYSGFNISRFEEYFDSLAALFTPALVTKHASAAQPKGERPVFIVGMQRSGSTLAAQILDSHPAARSIGESSASRLSFPPPPGEKFARDTRVTAALTERLSPDLLAGIRKSYAGYARLAADKDAVVVDKMLPNFMLLGLLKLAMPEAKFIHCQRDPVDAGLSVWTTLFFEPTPWAYDQRDIARYYKAQMKLMAHWQKLFPQAIHVLSYEKLVAEQEAETKKLLEFCGLPWDPRCLDFHTASGMVKTASVMQVRQPINAASVGKGSRAAAYLKDMLDELNKGVVAG
ncbi:MAG: sulfotransferase [Alphaproteobacteria bacterium]